MQKPYRVIACPSVQVMREAIESIKDLTEIFDKAVSVRLTFTYDSREEAGQGLETTVELFLGKVAHKRVDGWDEFTAWGHQDSLTSVRVVELRPEKDGTKGYIFFEPTSPGGLPFHSDE